MKRLCKKILSGVSAAVVAISTILAVSIPISAEDELQTVNDTTQILYGDINNDNVIDAADKTALSKAINDKTASTLVNADLNADGKVNNSDALLINKYVSGEIKYFPVGIYYEEGIEFVTRAEWVHNLVDMSVEDTSTVQ